MFKKLKNKVKIIYNYIRVPDRLLRSYVRLHNEFRRKKSIDFEDPKSNMGR
jgi:hypothetical protein